MLEFNLIILDVCSLVRPENLEELVNMVTQEPSEEQDEKLRYK